MTIKADSFWACRLGATAPGGYNGRFQRKAPLKSLDHKMTWQSGTHSWSFGGSWLRIEDDIWQYPNVPSVQFGVQTSLDRADAMFTAANFPGANTTVLNNARSLYGYLTGRVTGINANVALGPDGQYSYLGRTIDQHHLDEFGFVRARPVAYVADRDAQLRTAVRRSVGGRSAQRELHDGDVRGTLRRVGCGVGCVWTGAGAAILASRGR